MEAGRPLEGSRIKMMRILVKVIAAGMEVERVRR